MRLIPILALLALSGCTVKPFGFAPWVIVMPGAKLEVVIGNKSEDKRMSPTGDAQPVAPGHAKGNEKSTGNSSVSVPSSTGFKPPKMTAGD